MVGVSIPGPMEGGGLSIPYLVEGGVVSILGEGVGMAPGIQPPALDRQTPMNTLPYHSYCCERK